MNEPDDLVIRPAHAGEAATLTELAMRSKAHWGYDAAFMAVLRPILTVDEAALAASPVRVLDDREGTIGWYRLTGEPPSGELEDLWLDPAAIGHGRGRRLFEHARRTARELGFEELRIEADPHAEGFYAAMGATRIGERRSPSGRTLPLMRVATRWRSTARSTVRDAEIR
jgi:GNAT superfamily N-acetyltransferase